MPQIGQAPGASRTISGCIGQVHSTRVAATTGSSGSSAMPHFGQAAAFSLRTSGSIGQTHVVPAGASGAPSCASIAACFASRASQRAGSAANFVRHDAQQKR
jgi:hypothetical protein